MSAGAEIYRDWLITGLRSRRRILADAAGVLRADGYVGLANRVDARAAAVHAEITRQEEITARRRAMIQEHREARR